MLDNSLARMSRAQRAWSRLWIEIRSITPRLLLRALLVVAALYALGTLLYHAWVALTPFLAGFVLAYISSPLVDRLDGILPRPMAVLLVIIGEALLLVAIASFLIPPIIEQITRLVQSLPGAEDLRLFFANFAERFRSLPDPTETFIRDGLRQAATNIRENFSGYVRGLMALMLTSVFGLLRTVGFVLGFIALPTWLYSVLTDQRVGTRALDHLLPGWMRLDFWAVVRIIDRCLRVFIRGKFVQGMFVGAATYLGLLLLGRLGWPSSQYTLLMATTAGILEVIPMLGPLLATLLATLLGLGSSPEAALGILAVFIVVRLVVNHTVAPRYERKVARELHPALLVIAVVALSQVGFLWALLAAPLTVIARDLFLYTYGRLSDPPLPAGLLPGQPLVLPRAVRRSRRGQRSTQPSRAPVTAVPEVEVKP